jgi:hypothetical protein
MVWSRKRARRFRIVLRCGSQRPNTRVEGVAPAQSAVRNNRYKLIQVTPDTCDAEEPPLQLYRINEAPVFPLNASVIPLRLDFPVLNLIKDQNNPTAGLNPEQAENYTALKMELDSILNSEAACPGDGNLDGVSMRWISPGGLDFGRAARAGTTSTYQVRTVTMA